MAKRKVRHLFRLGRPCSRGEVSAVVTYGLRQTSQPCYRGSFTCTKRGGLQCVPSVSMATATAGLPLPSPNASSKPEKSSKVPASSGSSSSSTTTTTTTSTTNQHLQQQQRHRNCQQTRHIASKTLSQPSGPQRRVAVVLADHAHNSYETMHTTVMSTCALDIGCCSGSAILAARSANLPPCRRISSMRSTGGRWARRSASCMCSGGAESVEPVHVSKCGKS